jgi:hypothetical protein
LTLKKSGDKTVACFFFKERMFNMHCFNDKVNDYFDWLKKSAVVEEFPDGCFSIATPFMDSHNDGLVVYLTLPTDKSGGFSGR